MIIIGAGVIGTGIVGQRRHIVGGIRAAVAGRGRASAKHGSIAALLLPGVRLGLAHQGDVLLADIAVILTIQIRGQIGGYIVIIHAAGRLGAQDFAYPTVVELVPHHGIVGLLTETHIVKIDIAVLPVFSQRSGQNAQRQHQRSQQAQYPNPHGMMCVRVSVHSPPRNAPLRRIFHLHCITFLLQSQVEYETFRVILSTI